jgi:glycosyltransferase involved in cell wall biosynthesis
LIGIVGRLTEIKNHDLFLRMAARYKDQAGSGQDSRQVRFVVIGDGHLRATLEQQAQVLGLAENVVFTGSRQDPEYFYPALDIVALTSRNEGTPLTLIEAMLNARPVISTAVGGVVDLLGEIVEPETEAQPYAVCQRGISVRPDSDTGLAAGLARLITDVELRRTLGSEAAEFVAQHYSKDRLLQDLSGLYHELTHTAAVTVSSAAKRSLAPRV